MRILAIDTSTAVLSVAIMEDGKIIAEFTQNKALTHSEKLMPILDFVLKNENLKISDIDEFAVAVGPGSFTGIRIGVSMTNSFAMVRDKKSIGISTLQSLAYNIKNFDGIIIPTIYAQREDYYYSIYSGELLEIVKENASSLEDILEKVKEYADLKKVIFVGEICTNPKVEKIISKMQTKHKITLARESENYTRASNICYLAQEASGIRGKYAVPVYIRKSQAEVEYENRHKQS